jgi:hypothetical protein
MTSDFENDEIKDSSFPIDLTDDTTSLDMYGVWVKSGPRDVSASPKKGEASSFTDSVSFTDFPEPPVSPQEEGAEAPSARSETETSIDDFLDIGSLPDLPDFPDMQEDRVDAFSETSGEVPKANETEPEDIAESIEFEDIVPITFEEKGLDETSLPQKEREIPDTSWSEASIGVTETISLDSFDTEPEAALDTADSGFAAEPFEEVQFEDISFPAEEGESVEEVAKESPELAPENETSETVESLEAFERMETQYEAIEPQTVEESFEEPAEAIEAADTDDITLEDFIEPEITLKKPEEMSAPESEAKMEFSVEDFMGPQESPAKKDAAPSDDDFSSFLDDLNASPAEVPPSGDSGDLDLDSLINSVNEAGALGQEKENLFDDTEPLNIDLEFDESFIEDSAKIRATGSAVSESEFFNSEFGVELVDETTGSAGPAESERKESGMDFETLFQAVEEPTEKKDRAAKASLGTDSILEETSEFDDLLQSLDAAPVPAPVSDKGKSAVPASKGFNLDVTEEDSMVESITTSVSETSSDEDFSVSLFGAETVAEPSEQAPSTSTEAASIQNTDIAEDISIPEPETTEGEAETIEEIPTLNGEPITAMAFPDVEEIVDITQFKDYNNAESNPESAITEKASAEETVSLDFDDISAVEKDLSEENPVTGEDTVVTNDKSTELLMIIADELSSIKKEISTLKSEISGFKAGTAGEAPATQAPGAPVENSGFFSDDDTDETIALTGDELNNILITADFTEEKSDEPIAEGSSSPETPANESISVTEAPLSPEPAAVAEREPEIPETLPDTIFDVPGFESVENIEAAHVNQITDDVSYLEGSNDIEPDLDNVAIEEPELETIDFDDEKLEEPELTEFNIDLTGMETGFPAEQDIAVSEQPAVEELAVPEEPNAPEIEEFATTDTLSAQELAAIGGNVAPEAPVAGESDGTETAQATATLPVELKDEIKSVLSYMDQLLESLPEEKIEEFARSEHFEVYKKLFEELGIS